MIERDNIHHIYRWYHWQELERLESIGRPDEGFLVNLCWNCADGRGTSVDHAETPDQSEEMECEDCSCLNEQGAIWRAGMSRHNLNRIED